MYLLGPFLHWVSDESCFYQNPQQFLHMAVLIRRWNDRRNRGSEAVPTATTAVPTNSTKGATKRSKRVAQRLANEEPAPPPLKLPKLHLVLTRKEIQEDWLKITGHKYTGKPRKSTLIQRVCP